MNEPNTPSKPLGNPANPYRVPETPLAPPTRDPQAPSRRFYAFVASLSLALVIIQSVVRGIVPASARTAAAIVSVLLTVAAILTLLDWHRRQWARLPPRLQMIKGRGVAPRQVFGRCFIPAYNVYWLFVVNAALCDGINAMLAKKGRPRAAPVWLSVLCPLIVLEMEVSARLPSFGPGQGLAEIATFAVLWSVYMFCVERAFGLARRK